MQQRLLPPLEKDGRTKLQPPRPSRHLPCVCVGLTESQVQAIWHATGRCRRSPLWIRCRTLHWEAPAAKFEASDREWVEAKLGMAQSPTLLLFPLSTAPSITLGITQPGSRQHEIAFASLPWLMFGKGDGQLLLCRGRSPIRRFSLWATPSIVQYPLGGENAAAHPPQPLLGLSGMSCLCHLRRKTWENFRSGHRQAC